VLLKSFSTPLRGLRPLPHSINRKNRKVGGTCAKPPQCGEWAIESFEQHALQVPDFKNLLPPVSCLLSPVCGLLSIVYCPLSVVCGPLSIVYCLLSVVCGLWSVVRCLLSVVYCLWSVVRGPWSVVYCLLSIVYCLWSVVRGLLSIVCCLLSIVCGLWSVVSCQRFPPAARESGLRSPPHIS